MTELCRKPASASNGGEVSEGSQNLPGAKTFSAGLEAQQQLKVRSTNRTTTTGDNTIVYSTGSMIRINTGSSGDLIGISGGTVGDIIYLVKVTGGHTVTLKHESASAAAGDRLALPGSVDIVWSQLGVITMIYNGGGWFVVSHTDV